MKKITKTMVILLCSVTMAMMSSCSKESTNERRIIGTWVETCYIIYHYHADGTVSTEDYSQIAPSVYRFIDDEFVINSNGEWEPYSIDGDKLVIGDGWMAYTYTIIELTSSTLVWERRVGSEDGPYRIYHKEFEKQ